MKRNNKINILAEFIVFWCYENVFLDVEIFFLHGKVSIHLQNNTVSGENKKGKDKSCIDF